MVLTFKRARQNWKYFLKFFNRIGQYRKFTLVGRMHQDLGIEYSKDHIYKLTANYLNRIKTHPNSLVINIFRTRINSINIKELYTLCKLVFLIVSNMDLTASFLHEENAMNFRLFFLAWKSQPQLYLEDGTNQNEFEFYYKFHKRFIAQYII